MVSRTEFEALKQENDKLNKYVSKIMEREDHRRNYMKNYMAKARAYGRVKHWRQHKKERDEKTI